MERIMIIGCCGSGKTTLARKLSAKLGLPLVHLDKLGWRDNWQAVPADEFEALLKAEIAKDRWIIDGNYNRTISLRLERCDTVVYLDYPRHVCLWGVIKRVITGYGKSRPDMGGHCPERFDWDFMKFIWNFNRDKRVKYYTMLAECKAKVIILKNRKQADRFLQSL